MRPRSIVMFERLFLTSLVLSVVVFVMSYETSIAQLERMPEVTQLGIGSGVWTGAFLFGLALYLLLWFLIARKASKVAKWILIVFIALGLIALAGELNGPWDLVLILNVAVYAAQVGGVVYLFQDDAVAWLNGEWNTDTTPFD